MSLPADLSQRLAALSPAKRALLLSKLATGPVRQPDQKPVLSFAQERMLFLQRLFPDSHIYNTPMMIGLKGPLDVALLERSLNQIVARHEALRTLFPWREGGHGVEVLPRLELALTPQEIAPDALLNTLSTILRQPFALGSEPPIRARLLRLSPGHHVLALVLHHVAYDGWSRRLLLEELSRGYAGAELSPLPISYFDFARWQRARSFSEGLAYWRQVLDQAPDLTTLPADRWRGEKTSHAGGTHRFSLSPEIRQGLQGLAREADATLFMVMLAAFFTLVHRYSGQVDLVLGIPVAGRDRPEAQSLIGVFINSLAVRVRLEPSLSFPELLARVKQACLGAYGHQEVPFEHLVQQLGPGRDLTRHPFFQLFFNFRNLPQACLEPTDLELETLEIDRGVCAFDLTLEVVVDGPGLEVALTYSRDLFEPTTVASLAEHYRNILEAILESPGIGLDHIAMLSEPEIRFQLVDWNAGVHPPEPRTFPQLVGAQARLTPQAPAVVFGSRRLSYAELETKAGQLARYLMAQGVGQHEIVGLCLRRSLEMVIGLLAITKAGAAYLPLDPRGPASRNLTMLADAEARVVLTLSDQPLPDFPGLVLPLDSLPETVWTGEGDEVEVSASSLVYVLFTSGSTGRPKGVMIEHRQLTSYAGAVGQRCQLGPGLSYAMVQPLTVDSSQTVLAASLTTGGCLHILSEEMSLDAPALGELFCREGIQVLKIAPSHLAALMRSSSAPLQLLPREVLILGGEASTWSWLDSFLEQAPCRVFNHYGPTETTVGSLACDLRESPRPRTVPIGRPLSGNSVYILDARLQPLPLGVAGELYIGGVQVARGYLGSPELTEQRFLPNPFAEGRIYRTGDKARYTWDGRVEFLGRDDHQVKIRGWRVELSEIERTLCEIAGVSKALVLAGQDSTGDKVLQAYLVAPDGLDLESVRAHLAARLPDPMIPRRLMVLDRLPLSAHGKVDLQALPEITPELPPESEPLDALERQVSQIWKEALGVEPIGPHQNFFELGGHSLLAMLVVARLQQELALEVTLRSLFEKPTVRQLAAEIRQSRPLPVVLEKARPGQSLPLSLQQEQLLFVELAQSGPSAYNQVRLFRLFGELDVGALEQSLQALARRHEVLRTTIAWRDGEPCQVVHDQAELSWAVHPEGSWTEADLQAWISQPFDFAAAPAYRTGLWRHAKNDHTLALVLHHLLIDHWSFGVLVAELSALYNSLRRGLPSPLAPLAVSYGDYALWQRRHFQTAADLRYWRGSLEGAPFTTRLPLIGDRPVSGSEVERWVAREVPESLSCRLEQFHRERQTTEFVTLFAAFQALLFRLTGQTSLVVGAPMQAQRPAGMESVLGYYSFPFSAWSSRFAWSAFGRTPIAYPSMLSWRRSTLPEARG